IFAVDRDEIARLDELQDQLLLFLAGMAGNVNGSSGIFVVNERATAEHVVEHAADGFFVARNDSRGKKDRVVLFDGCEAMIVDRDSRERRHGLGLTAASENDEALRVEAANVGRPYDHSVWNAQIAE